MEPSTDFDRSSRHLLTAALLREIVEPPGPILELGGSQGFTPDLLPNYKVTVTDVAGDDVALRASAAAVPFKDGLFAAVIALDVLEHVPVSMRPAIVSEMARLSSSAVIVGGPFDEPEIRDAEERTRDLYRYAAGRPHRWLSEHHDFGLPSFDDVTRLLEEAGFVTTSVPTNPLEVWEPLQLLNFAAAETGAGGPADRVHELLNRRFLGGGDQAGTPYRRILVGIRDEDPEAAALRAVQSLGRQATPLSIADAKLEIDRSIAETFRESVLARQRLERFLERKQTETVELHEVVTTREAELRQVTRANERDRASLERARTELTRLEPLNRELEAKLASTRGDLTRSRDEAEQAVAARVESQLATRRLAIRHDLLETLNRIEQVRAEVSRGAALMKRVAADLQHLERSRRWQLGNRLGRVFSRPFKRHPKPAPVQMRKIATDEFPKWKSRLDESLARIEERARRIAAELNDPVAATRLDHLEKVAKDLDNQAATQRAKLAVIGKWRNQLGTHAKRLEQSRRWKMGSAIGSFADALLLRTQSDNVAARLRRRINEFQPPAEPKPMATAKPGAAPAPSVPRGPQRGRTRTLDRAIDNEAYTVYIEKVEPEVLQRLSQQSAATLRFVVIDRGDDDSAVELERSLAASKSLGGVSLWTTRADTASLPSDSIDIVRLHDSSDSSWGSLLDGLEEDFVVFLAPGDVPSPVLPNALGRVGENVAAVVFDHDEIDSAGARSNPQFKPSFSPDWLIEFDYVGRGAAFRTGALGSIDRIAISQAMPPRDLLFRIWQAELSIDRIEAILLHTRPPQTSSVDRIRRDREFAANTIARLGWNASVDSRQHVVHVRHRAEGKPLVSIVIPFKDKPDLLQVAVNSILRLTTYDPYEIVLVDNASTEPATASLLESWAQEPRIRVIDYDAEFNYSAANNLGVAHAKGDVLVLLNNDTQVLSPQWLEDFVGQASRPDIGAVGAHLSFADGSIQHAGVVVGMRGFAAHLFSGDHPPFVRSEWINQTRNTSAVTAACLAVTRSKYEEIGGFDENFILTGNDVDFCLRLLKRGYRNVYVPSVRLFHFEKQSRSAIQVPDNDKLLSFNRYQPHLTVGDPYFNTNLSLETNRLQPRTQKEAGVEKLREELFGGRKNPKDEQGFLRLYDAGAAELAANAAVIERFATERSGPIDTVSWFVPSFDHVYRGGIYTIMRIANSLTQRAGTRNQFVVCGKDDADAAEMTAQIEEAFPEMRYSLIVLRSTDSEADLPAADVGICTLWTTAYHLLRYNQVRGKFYLVQDFEPGFAAANSIYGLIEQTYRFGYSGIANTKGVGDAYRSYGNETVHFTPAVDRSIFHPAKHRREGPIRIVFYGRPKNPRNGFELGLQALTEVKTRYGDRVEITSVGAVFNEAAYGVEHTLVNSGILPNIEAVAEQYRSSDIGLVFMFTKHPSYQPLEYMASGCATVTNVNESNLWLLKDRVNAMVVPPTVGSVADAISELIEDQALRKQVIKGGLESVSGVEWEDQLDTIYGFITKGIQA